jgi:hypothetical protein
MDTAMYQQLIHQIDRFREKSIGEPVPLAAQSDTLQVSACLVDLDRLSYRLTALEVRSLEAREISQDEISARVEALLGRATYLTETLAVVERAADLRHVLIRSANPQRTGDGASYYEITMKEGNSIRLQRWRYDAKARRRLAVPFTLSQEIFKRLIEDLEAVFAKVEERGLELPPRFKDVPSAWDVVGF